MRKRDEKERERAEINTHRSLTADWGEYGRDGRTRLLLRTAHHPLLLSDVKNGKAPVEKNRTSESDFRIRIQIQNRSRCRLGHTRHHVENNHALVGIIALLKVLLSFTLSLSRSLSVYLFISRSLSLSLSQTTTNHKAASTHIGKPVEIHEKRAGRFRTPFHKVQDVL